MVAAASSIAVVYPHMTGIGGDAFWLIAAPGQAPIAIDASGGAAGQATLAFYAERHLQTIPTRGPLAANTVAGTIGGWAQALELSAQQWGGRLPLTRLLADSIFYARDGVPVTLSQQRNTENKRAELQSVTGFAERFMPDGQVPLAGRLFKQTRLANTN
jgi:oxamate amidohydrolase